MQINNKSYNPTGITSPKQITIHDESTPQRLDLKASQLAWRIQQEVIYNSNNGGFTSFYTFTYDNQHLPWCNYRGIDGNIYRASCWDKHAFTNLVKTLRTTLTRYYGIKSSAFRYLVCCERGYSNLYVADSGRTRIGTSRPHYHALFMYAVSPESLPIKSLRTCPYIAGNIDALPLHNFIEAALPFMWGRGNIDDKMLVRTPAVAARYVAKYMQKQYDDKMFRRVFPKNVVSVNVPQITDYSGRKTKKTHNYKLTDVRPFHNMSNGIGKCYYPSQEEFDGKMVPLIGSNKDSYILLPRYYYQTIYRNAEGKPDSRNFHITEKLDTPLAKIHVSASWDEQCGYLPARWIEKDTIYVKPTDGTKGMIKVHDSSIHGYADPLTGEIFPYRYPTKCHLTQRGFKSACDNFNRQIDEELRKLQRFIEYPQAVLDRFETINQAAIEYTKAYELLDKYAKIDSYTIQEYVLDGPMDIEHNRDPHFSLVDVVYPECDHYDSLNNNINEVLTFLRSLRANCANSDEYLHTLQIAVSRVHRGMLHSRLEFSIRIALDIIHDSEQIVSINNAYNRHNQYKNNLTNIARIKPELLNPHII